MTKSRQLTRRNFLSKTATMGAALTILPRNLRGRGFTAPSDTLNIAGIGVGGMGRANLINLASQNIVALCDVDWGYAGNSMDRLDADIQNLQKRLDQPDRPPQAGAKAPPFDRTKAHKLLDNMIQLKANLPKAARYAEYREMLEKQKDID